MTIPSDPKKPGGASSERDHVPGPDRAEKPSLRSRLEQLVPEVGPIGPDTLSQARLSHHQAQSPEIVEAARRMYERNPSDRKAADWLAFLLYSNQHYKEAIKLFEQLVANGQGTISQHYYLANCCVAVGDLRGAVDHWNEVWRKEPEGLLAKKAMARLRYVSFLLGGGG
jgi:tetratricopeptide (TPR) repeat protein